QQHLAFAYRFVLFVGQVAADGGVRIYREHQSFRDQARSYGDRGRESLVLFEGLVYESMTASFQRVFAGRDVQERKMTAVVADGVLHLIALLGRSDGDIQ